MYDSYRPHPLLAQIPLTVSPFISLPTAVTLPYTYKSVPSTLPPSVTVDPSGAEKARFVVSSSGHAAHPDEILASCKGLGEHMKKTRANAEKTIREWEESIKQRELAERRRVAPGWLDRDEKLLRPMNSATGLDHTPPSLLDSQPADTSVSKSMPPAIAARDEGEELDRAFGGLGVK